MQCRKDMSLGLLWIIVIFLFLLIVIIYVALFFFPGTISSRLPVELIIQSGTNASTDVMTTGGNNLYDGSANIPSGFTLTLSSNNENTPGRIYYVKNNSLSNDISLVAGEGATYVSSGGVNNIVTRGATAFLTIKGGNNAFYRIS